ncbi:MAG TPA: DUF3467 domain-containing protein [Gemmataceae bacterium]|jgi:hypothetical protein|nr:DUF3467 domain-containing protein [Gemmataceae bacterium]
MNSDQHPNPPPGSGGYSPGDLRGFTQELQHSQASARVPEKVGRGVFSTGALIIQGQHEFAIDFVVRIANPHQVAARVIMAHTLIPAFVQALRENLNNYQTQFGPPPPLPTPPPSQPMPSVEEIYQQLKLSDDMLSGVYANAVMIAHTPAEFCFDFITNFYPRSAVSCRVYLSAPQIPGFLNSLVQSYQQYQQKMGQPFPPPPDSRSPKL